MADDLPADAKSGIPAAWRVTLSWPIPVGWATGNWHVRDVMGDPAEEAKMFGYLYHGTVADVAVTLRKRTLGVAMTVPAEEPKPGYSNVGYRTSSERAITVAVQCARFAYRLLTRGEHEELPEPVRIAARPLGGHRKEATPCPALCRWR